VKANLREALRVALPSLVKLLEHGSWGVLLTAASLLSNLATHGESYQLTM
jgi:hypothetical protein